MTAQELVEKLQDHIDAYGPEAEVRLAEQPSYPFEYSILGCTDSLILGADPDDEDNEHPQTDEAGYPKEPPVFYIVEGSQLGYFRRDAWDACR